MEEVEKAVLLIGAAALLQAVLVEEVKALERKMRFLLLIGSVALLAAAIASTSTETPERVAASYAGMVLKEGESA